MKRIQYLLSDPTSKVGASNAQKQHHSIERCHGKLCCSWTQSGEEVWQEEILLLTCHL